jgi:hypothetical protein
MPRSQLTEELGGEVRAGCGGDLALREGAECGGPAPRFEHRSLAEHSPRADLGHRGAVNLDRENTVEEQIHLGTLGTLLDQRRALPDRSDSWLRPTAHDPQR